MKQLERWLPVVLVLASAGLWVGVVLPGLSRTGSWPIVVAGLVMVMTTTLWGYMVGRSEGRDLGWKRRGLAREYARQAVWAMGDEQ